jgi:hypothetical protein
MVRKLRRTLPEVSVSNGEVSIGQAFQFEVEKLARRKQVVFEYSDRSNEQLRFEIVDGIPNIVANKQGILALAKFLVTLGVAQRPDGLSLHLRQDFDGEREEILRVRLEEPGAESSVNADEKPLTII